MIAERMSVEPGELDANGRNDGRYPCAECGVRCMFAIPRGDRPTCGDCLEGRTPLKKTIARLRAQVDAEQADNRALRSKLGNVRAALDEETR
jgi:hypothetical protein